MKLLTMHSPFHFPVTSSLLGPNVYLSTLFLNNLTLCSSLSVRDQVSYSTREEERIWDWWYSIICFDFQLSNCDLLVLFPDVWSLSHSQSSYWVYLCCDSVAVMTETPKCSTTNVSIITYSSNIIIFCKCWWWLGLKFGDRNFRIWHFCLMTWNTHENIKKWTPV